MSVENIDGKREVLRVTIPGKDHPKLVALENRASKLGHYPNQYQLRLSAAPLLGADR